MVTMAAVTPVPLVVLFRVGCRVCLVVVVTAMFGVPISVGGRFGGVGVVCHVCP
ncbi:hypothetical protein MYFR107205_01675 [Mycolicibacterium frederiksbergense]